MLRSIELERVFYPFPEQPFSRTAREGDHRRVTEFLEASHTDASPYGATLSGWFGSLRAWWDRFNGRQISSTARIHPTAYVGKNVTIHNHVVIGPNAFIGDNSFIGPYCLVSKSVVIGPHVLLTKNVLIDADVSIGSHCQFGDALPGMHGCNGLKIVRSGTTIGHANVVLGRTYISPDCRIDSDNEIGQAHRITVLGRKVHLCVDTKAIGAIPTGTTLKNCESLDGEFDGTLHKSDDWWRDVFPAAFMEQEAGSGK